MPASAWGLANSDMTTGVLWLAVFLVIVVAGIGGMFLYGWLHRKDKMPKVAPLPPDDDDDWGKKR